ncbi:DUF2785 domain-containing protein [Paenibacillus sp. FSL R7-0337]|uniref:DUF2785 domain-containing protein n=1 Tax=unclassified Paenibacillus TaxID=185978 RepID=UPI00096E4DA8|nr:DUF2785 domain-containing protein [Paenibacillus sp. FSL R7-0337]OMF88993.1 hypothetical protein BK147_26205 [Paenibacillus sp. FSL R7-0337]
MNIKETLQFIQTNNYQAPPDAFPLAQDMLLHIGSIDAELRDDLIYTTFSHWIPGDVLSVPELEQLLLTTLDTDHLHYKLGEQGTDSVFTRSFSMLIVPLLLIRHRASPFLSQEQIHEVKKKVLYSIQEERDYRGYDEDKGWAHAIAHGADALDDLAQCSELEHKDLMDILHLIHSKMTITDRVYSDGEDERMVRAVISVLNRRLLSKDDVERWIQYFYEAKVSASTDFLPAFRQKNNIKNFLKSLYFQVKFHQTDAALCPVIEQTLYQVDSVYYG